MLKHTTKIGVMGSAGGNIGKNALDKATLLGEEIAEHDCTIVTGACPGLPHAVAVAAHERGTLTVGISPGLSLEEHVVRYNSPYEVYDVMIYTGSGLMGREITAIRSCDIVTILGGRSGTLGEFSIAYDEGKLIAVLQGTGGIADNLHKIVEMIDKETNAEIVYDENPKDLLEKAIELHDERIREGRAYYTPQADG
ncbi:MAG: hypothetical protein ACLFWB_05070 [Armatimonadota bacterium]